MLEMWGRVIMVETFGSPTEPKSTERITSDIQKVEPTTFLEEPTSPRKEDYSNPENYEFALSEYKHKFEVYQARTKWVNERKKIELQIAEFAKNIKFIEQELGKVDWGVCVTDENPFRASELAACLMKRPEYNIVTDKDSEVIYLYIEKLGIYRKDGEQILRTMIDMGLEKESTTHRINETINLLKYKTYAAIIPSKKIAVLNGLLDIQTGLIEPFTKYEFNTNKLNAEYKEGARSEPWEKFIEQVCPDDKFLLQEWSGYLLIKGYPYHSIMWLYGPTGRNGKGTWARTMQSVLGPENYSCVSIDEFDGKHRFAVFNLHDSLFNICSEPRTDKILTVEMLQMLSGADDIDAERKGVQERFKFRNGAKMTVMGNKFPNVDKPTDAFWERLKLCKFPARFIGPDQKPEIEKNWLEDPEQRSGILNWMIEGAKRLINNGFTLTKTQEETIIQFKRASDSIGAFLAECVEFDANAFVGKAQVQEYYKEYCSIIGVPNNSDKALSDKFKNTPRIKDTSTYTGLGKEKKKVKVWRGIKLKSLPENENESQEDIKNGTSGTAGTDSGAYTLEKYPVSYNISQEYAQKTVPSVPSVPNSEPEKSMIRESTLVSAKRFKPKAGVLCQQPEQDEQCPKEAEFSIKNNLYCPSHFNEEKENLRNQGKIVCAENIVEGEES